MEILLSLILLLVVNSLIIIGLYHVVNFEVEEGYGYDQDTFEMKREYTKTHKMILWWVKYWGDKYINEFWSKSLYDCVVCMASVHSLYVYWYFYSFDLEALMIYPFYILALAGLNSILNFRF